MNHVLLLMTNFLADVNVDGNGFITQTKSLLAGPILNGAQLLIPAAVGVSGIHKLMEHRETAGSLLIELLTKGGGSLLTIQLVKAMVGV